MTYGDMALVKEAEHAKATVISRGRCTLYKYCCTVPPFVSYPKLLMLVLLEFVRSRVCWRR